MCMKHIRHCKLGWIHLAHNRDRIWDVVNTVMSIPMNTVPSRELLDFHVIFVLVVG